MLFSVPIPAKLKAIVAFVTAVVIVLTGAFADDVFDASDTATLVTQLAEAALVYVATFKVRNRPA